MPPESPPISAVELKTWRLKQSFSQEQVGDKLGVSHSAVNRWEKGDAIPGPADKLLRMLIRSEMPLDLPAAELGSQVREDIGAVEMTVEAFEECLRRSREAGFGSVTEWIADLVRAELGSKPDGVNNPDQPNTRVDYLRTDGRGWKKPFREVEMTFPSLEAAVEAAMTKI